MTLYIFVYFDAMHVHEEREAWLALSAYADQQYGLVTREQLGTWFSRQQIGLRAKRGLLLPTARGVWRLGGSAPSWRQRVAAACLAIGPPVAVSHAAAGRLWQLDGIAARDAVDLTVATARHPTTGLDRVAIHRSGLLADEITQHQSIPVTSPARTITDLAGCIAPPALARAMDYALRQHLTTVPELRRQLELRTRVRGSALLGDLVSQREEHGAGDSAWEDEVFGWLLAAGLPIPRRQYELVLPRRLIVLDLAYPDERVGVEFDGFEWHRSRGRFDRDRERLGDLAAAGWAIVPVTSSSDQEETVDRVKRTLLTRGWHPREPARGWPPEGLNSPKELNAPGETDARKSA
jgi:hypothetical protein